MTNFEGFIFTPASATAPTAAVESKREDARSKIDRSLDDIIRDSHREDSGRGDTRSRKPRPRDSNQYRIFINLPLSDREVQRYLRTADLDAEGYEVRLRLVLIKNSSPK
jgi:hypothetical protein